MSRCGRLVYFVGFNESGVRVSGARGLLQRQQEQLAALLGSELVLSGASSRRLALGHIEQVRTVESFPLLSVLKPWFAC
jgi:hypothetical protein